ncbi:hydroxypyruvate isomerase family protein [Chachezhania sediminis]|uniref:hydroxypyruvate isomerase family protein n=1 Tax=Chachezhania sediminis TaxID=2599291 RepID=UPI00131B0F7E|nr:TIM barrel protein [Chachezhania sediminis]
MRLAANISLLFTEYPFEDRFRAAADAGFDGVEILFPYDRPATAVADLARQAGLVPVLMNAPPPVPAGRPRGFPAEPGQGAIFRAQMEGVLSYAGAFRPGLIHVMAGYSDDPSAVGLFVDNLRWLCDQAPDQGFAIEPLNQGDQPGYVLSDYALAAEILEAVNRPNLGLQYDSYHSAVIHGDALEVWNRYGARAVHVQLGAAPDRSEPGRGPTDFTTLLSAIEASRYRGWISAEYNPSTDRTEDSLGWMSGRA